MIFSIFSFRDFSERRLFKFLAFGVFPNADFLNFGLSEFFRTLTF